MAKKKSKKKIKSSCRPDREYITKIICIKNVNKSKFDKIKKYVELILAEKNHIAKSVPLCDKYLIHKGILKKEKFDKQYQNLEQLDKNVPKTDIQQARYDICVKLKNMYDACEFNSYRTKIKRKPKDKKKLEELKLRKNYKSYKNESYESDLSTLISYICKQISYSDYIPNEGTSREQLEKDLMDIELQTKKIFNYLENKANKANNATSANSMYKKWIKLITKFSYERILTLCIKKYLNVLNRKVTFKKLTITHKNTISSLKTQVGLVNLKKFNAFLNFNIPKQGEIALLFRYNQNYHMDLKDFMISGTQKAKLEDLKRFPTGYKQTQFTFTINVDTLYNQINIYYTLEKISKNSAIYTKFDLESIQNYNNYVGVDVNIKNNILALSDGKTFKANKSLIKKCIRFDNTRKRYQRNKDLNHNPKPYGKEMLLRQEKNNKRSKWYLEQLVNEFLNYCEEKGYNHIVMENLNLKETKSEAKNKDGINYNRIASLLHLNDIKNVIKRLANKRDIAVSWVNPKYTSRQCPICGHINKNNRITQEIFCCEKCFHNNNADINAAINIKNRVFIKEYKSALMKFDKEFNGYKGKVYIKKEEYEELVKNLKNNPNKKNFGYDGIEEWLKLDV